MFTPKGKFGWFELMTSDTKAARQVLLSTSSAGPPANMSGGGDQIHHLQPGRHSAWQVCCIFHQHTGWIGYIAVDNVDAHIEKIVEAGGRAGSPPLTFPGMFALRRHE